MSIARAPDVSIDMAIYDPPTPRDVAVSQLVAEVCGPLTDVLSPSAARKVRFELVARLERVTRQAEKLVADHVELACLQRELTRHVADCFDCAQPELRCRVSAGMELRERELLSTLAGGMP